MIGQHMAEPRVTTSSNALTPVDGSPQLGNMYGTGLVAAMEYFVAKYGPSAAHATISRMPAPWRHLVRPNTDALGLLGAKKYPYAFVGELIRTMCSVVKKDEDTFIRELASAGFDRTLNTVARVLMRYLVSPSAIAQRSPEIWRLFHDSSQLKIVQLTDTFYLSQVSQWIGHDVIVCKLGVEAGRRVVERTGVRDVEARREKCVAWGHDVCLTRVKWAP